MLEPIFVKGDIHFSLGDYNLSFKQQKVSSFGVTGLAWSGLDPTRHFGKLGKATITTATPKPLTLSVNAHVIRELTLYSDHMGFRFMAEAEAKEQLSQQIRDYGYIPTDHVRKYPRIPSTRKIQTYPLRVTATGADMSQALAGTYPIVFDIENISPNGLLISTENQIALSLSPGHRLEMVVEPRGSFPMQIKVQGLICRIIDDLNPESGNMVRHLGVSFSRVDEMNRAAFLSLLKDIVEKIQTIS